MDELTSVLSSRDFSLQDALKVVFRLCNGEERLVQLSNVHHPHISTNAAIVLETISSAGISPKFFDVP